ncbi:hypothetical protein FACS189419_00710 [Planctomycetales bacterium]|nr:hypothetical protein FACS189419_00710 [Planctomycetales bacterium]
MPQGQAFLFSEEAIQKAGNTVLLPPWEIDDLKNRKIAKVVFPSGFDTALDYLVPNHLAAGIEPGKRVAVPLGKSNRSEIAYCIAVNRFDSTAVGENVRLKPVLSILDDRRLIDDKMFALTKWISRYYLCPLGQVLECVLPAGVRTQAGTRLAKVLYLEKELRIDNGKLIMRAAKDNNAPYPLTVKQLHIIETLKQAEEPLTLSELLRSAKCSVAPVNALKQIGVIKVKTTRRRSEKKTEEEDKNNVPTAAFAFPLNADQQRCLSAITEAIKNRRNQTFLLHGVTGSGKTEVYIQAIQKVVQHKQQAIVLVPEISLTPQTVKRFKDRFQNVAVLHSHLTDAERHRQWTQIAGGEVQVVVGTRSAVFAPLPRLGLIVIDEEHENSFKQDSAPRYQTRDVAGKRAELEQIPLVLGSATPSLETLHASFHLLEMPERVMHRPLPYVEIVDLREAVQQRTTRGGNSPATASGYLRIIAKRRTSHFIAQPAGIFNAYSMSGVRRSCKMSELRCFAHAP